MARYKAIIIPFAKFSRKEVPERLLAYVKAGGTLVCADPEAFSFDLEGSDTCALREALLGVGLAGKGDEKETRLRLSPSPLWPDLDTSQSLPVLAPCLQLQLMPGADVLGTFEDGAPAIVLARLEKGRAISFAFNPFLLKPFASERRYISDAVFQPAWQTFFRAFLRGLGIQIDREIYRFRFPPFKTVCLPAPACTCLTGNYVEWRRETPVTEHNARIDGTYRFSASPDAVADVADGAIPFTQGKLTDRIRAARADPSEGVDKRVVRWDAAAAFDLTIEFARPCRMESVALICSGAVPDIQATLEDGTVLGKADAQDAGEDVRRISIPLHAQDPIKTPRLRFGPRPAGKSFTLAEMEVWGTDTGEEK